MTVRHKLAWAALAAAGALAATLALARSPSDDFGPSSGGTAPAAGETAVVHSPYGRTITVYGSIETNDALVFMDRTGNRVRGTNLVAAAQAELYATNALTRAMIAALQAGTNNWNAAYAWGDWSGRVGALEAGTNDWNAAAVLAGTALQPADAATLTVASARRLVAADSNSWSAVEGVTNWLYTISYIADTNSLTTTAGEFGAGMTFDFQADMDEYIWFQSDRFGEIQWYRETSASPGVIQYLDAFTYENSDHHYDWPDPDGMPVTLTEAATGKTMTLDWVQRLVTNRVQIGTQPGTVILITEHDEDPDAHTTLPRYDGVSNIVSAAVAALPRVPTNAVTGWLMYDYGSNMWLRVSVSNWSFTVWEVVE